MVLFSCYQKSFSASIDDSSRDHSREQNSNHQRPSSVFFEKVILTVNLSFHLPLYFSLNLSLCYSLINLLSRHITVASACMEIIIEYILAVLVSDIHSSRPQAELADFRSGI